MEPHRDAWIPAREIISTGGGALRPGRGLKELAQVRLSGGGRGKTLKALLRSHPCAEVEAGAQEEMQLWGKSG